MHIAAGRPLSAADPGAPSPVATLPTDEPASDKPATEAPATETPAAEPGPATRKFTALIEERTGDAFDAVVTEVGHALGRIAGRRQDAKGGRLPSRADVLRALVTLASDDPNLRRRVIEQVRTDLTARRS